MTDDLRIIGRVEFCFKVTLPECAWKVWKIANVLSLDSHSQDRGSNLGFPNSMHKFKLLHRASPSGARRNAESI